MTSWLDFWIGVGAGGFAMLLASAGFFLWMFWEYLWPSD
jgi:hypothetical protein